MIDRVSGARWDPQHGIQAIDTQLAGSWLPGGARWPETLARLAVKSRQIPASKIGRVLGVDLVIAEANQERQEKGR